MPYAFLTLYPTNPGSSFPYSSPIAQTPTVMGSVADDSDATYTTLEGEYQTSGDRYSDVLTVDFALPDPSTIPAFLVMQMRARDNADFQGNPYDQLARIVTWYSPVADPTSFYDEWELSTGAPLDEATPLSALVHGAVTSPQWETFYYLGSLAPSPTNPEDGRWAPTDPGTGYVASQHRTALAGDGIRFTIYVQSDSNLAPRIAFLDVFELRMLVAFPATTPAYVPPSSVVRPSLRMTQRGGEGGMYGVPRMVGNPVHGLRQGPGAVY